MSNDNPWPRIHGQSVASRRARLDRGCCPVHGIGMSQVFFWFKRCGGKLDGLDVTVVGCPRKDCRIEAFAASCDGPWELCPEHLYLFRDDGA
jgi:hypothetical protein